MRDLINTAVAGVLIGFVGLVLVSTAMEGGIPIGDAPTSALSAGADRLPGPLRPEVSPDEEVIPEPDQDDEQAWPDLGDTPGWAKRHCDDDKDDRRKHCRDRAEQDDDGSDGQSDDDD